MEKLKIITQEVELFSKLLKSARIVSEAQLKEAASCAQRLDISLDRALTMLKMVSPESLRPALAAKEMVIAGQISLEEASLALQHARQKGISFEEALPKNNEHENDDNNDGSIHLSTSKPIHPLADLLLTTKLVTPEQLNQAIQKASDMDLPLGKTLIVNRFMNRWTLGQVITAASLIDEEKTTKENAYKFLQDAVQHRTSFIQILFESGNYINSPGETLTLPELLIMAECLTEADYQDVQEHKLIEKKPYAQIISENKLIESNLLQSALSLLEMIGNYLKPFQAAEALKQVAIRKIPDYQAIAELKPPPQIPQMQLRLGDLLVESGIIGRDAVEAIVSKQNADTTLVHIGKMFLEAHLIDDNNLYKSLRCQSAFREGVVSAKQAVAVLSCAYDEKLKVEDAFAKCGVYAPLRMQWNWQ
jgi:hypothetical protein